MTYTHCSLLHAYRLSPNIVDGWEAVDYLECSSQSVSQLFCSLPALIESIRLRNDGGLLPGSASGPTAMMQSGINQAKDTNDPPGLQEKTEFLLREWVMLYHNPTMVRDSGKLVFNQFVTQVIQLSRCC